MAMVGISIDTVEGVNVVLLGSDTEGTNRYDAKDVNGFEYMKAIINAGLGEYGGYVNYHFPREGETEPSPKRSYSILFEPFNWVVGTGDYTDDIDQLVQSMLIKSIIRRGKQEICYLRVHSL